MMKHRGAIRNAIKIKKKPQREEQKKKNVLKRQKAIDKADKDVHSKTSFENDFQAVEDINAELEELHLDYELPDDPSARKRWIAGVRAARGNINICLCQLSRYGKANIQSIIFKQKNMVTNEDALIVTG